MSTLHAVLPTLRPVGGVVKVFDYLTHARDAGWAVHLFAPDAASPDLPLFRIDRFAGMVDDPEVVFTTDPRSIRFIGGDLGLLSLPSQYPLLHAGLRRYDSPERIIHLVQNVRHATPQWQDGYATRLLGRPMARIMTNDVVMDAVSDHLHPRSFVTTIPLGHPTGYFAMPDRGPLHDPLRVGYTTWKSDVGDRVAERLDGDERFTFRAIREHVGWEELRELYQWCDVFLGTPNKEEGFYMPAFEAMEAGALVVVPDAGGNMAFCRFGENCFGVAFDDAADYVEALQRVRHMADHGVRAMRSAADEARRPFDLAAERSGFHHVLGAVAARVAAAESGNLPADTWDVPGEHVPG